VAGDDGRVRTVALVVLATLAVVAALYVGRPFLAPIALALLFDALLRPAVRRLERLRLPTPLAALIVLVAVLTIGALAVSFLESPVRDWVRRAPETLATARDKLDALRRPIQQIRHAAEAVDSAARSAGSPSAGAQPPAPASAPPAPGASAEGTASRIGARVFGGTATFVGGAVEVLVLLYLLLAAGDLFRRKLVEVLPLAREKREAVAATREVEQAISRYLVTTALINVVQGIVVALVMWALGMPSPELWGALTFFVEFVPYLGAALMLILLAIAGLATFSAAGRIVAPPLAYLVITTLQNNVVSPIAYGRRLKLNAVVVLVAVLFWWSIWGVVGAFLAVPVVAALKIVADHVERLRPVGAFLGEDSRRARG
jgi:predicted PurR-regulated permease PerM